MKTWILNGHFANAFLTTKAPTGLKFHKAENRHSYPTAVRPLPHLWGTLMEFEIGCNGCKVIALQEPALLIVTLLVYLPLTEFMDIQKLKSSNISDHKSSSMPPICLYTLVGHTYFILTQACSPSLPTVTRTTR